MEQDTGKKRLNRKDQFYTKASVAKKCVDKILATVPSGSSYQLIEPSAGNGVFLKCLAQNFDRIGMDIEPKDPEIFATDFLAWIPTTYRKRIFFGNPPFGRQGSLAKAFIKHAASYADYIAFILPRSFVKPSMSRAFPLAFHCILSEDVEKNAFEVNETAYNVPCVFQIWEKRVTDRVLEPPVDAVGFEYVKEGFHIAFKRVGGLAGKCYSASASASAEYNPQYHYFLKLEDQYVPFIQKIIDLVNVHVFPTNTVGMRSLSKTEANRVLNQTLASLFPSPQPFLPS